MAFAILLFQDLVAIPLLAAIPLLGGAKEQTLNWPIALQAIGTLALVVIGGRYVLRYVLRVWAGPRVPKGSTPPRFSACLGPRGSCRGRGCGVRESVGEGEGGAG